MRKWRPPDRPKKPKAHKLPTCELSKIPGLLDGNLPVSSETKCNTLYAQLLTIAIHLYYKLSQRNAVKAQTPIISNLYTIALHWFIGMKLQGVGYAS